MAGIFLPGTSKGGDISGVTAGVGLSGGGDSGGVTLTLDLSELSTVTPADGDFFSTLDSDGANEQKTTTTALATLFAGAGMTAANAVVNVIGGDGITANSNDVAITAAQTTITSIYNSALILGGDDETAIDFGTSNEIDFKADDAVRLTLTASALYPVTNNQIDLGTASLEFKDAFFDGTVTADAFAGPLTGDVTGTSSKATVTDSTANTNFPVVFHDESDALLDDTGALRYNPSTGQLLVPNLTVAGTTTTVDTVTMEAANAVIFEGATADAHETTLSIVDPTGDHTQYLLNQGGYIPLLAAVTTTAISSTPGELNLIDGDTSRDTNAVASGDGLLVNDAGTMHMTDVDTVSTYFSSHNVGGGNIVTTGALDSGSITSGFGAIDNGTSNIRTATITAETAVVPDAASGATLGTTSLEWGHIYVGDDQKLYLGDAQDVSLEYDEDGTDQLRISGKTVFDNDMEVADSKFIEFASTAGTPTTDNTVQGVVIEFLAVEAITQFDAVYVSTTTGRVGRADANDAAKLPAIGIAIEAQGSAGSSVRVLTHGVYRDDGGFGGNMTVGVDLYVSETPGTLTATAPGDSDDFVQIMGVAVGVRSAFINPDMTIVKID